MTNGIHSYPKILNLGQRALDNLTKSPVIIQEKIDGSQFTFRLTPDGEGGISVDYRSKNVQIDPNNPGMFRLAVESVERFVEENTDLLYLYEQLGEPINFRCEFLQKQKHNSLNYNRIPQNHLVVFDIESGESYFAPQWKVKAFAEKAGFDYATVYYEGEFKNQQQLFKFCEGLGSSESILGGPIEGMVIKAYDQLDDRTGKVLMGKYVRPEFKETHQKDWKDRNPNRKDVLENIVGILNTERRWEKAVEHLRDEGKILGEPRDIGTIIREVQKDVFEENLDDIITPMLVKWATPLIKKQLGRGVAEWYKERLVEGVQDDTD